MHSVLTHHLAEDEELGDEEPDDSRLHGVGRSGERERLRRGGRESVRRLGSSRLESGRVGSGRVVSVGAQRSASGSSPTNPRPRRLGTDRKGIRIGAVRLARGAGCLFGGRALALLPLWLGGGGGVRAAHCT